MQVNIFNRFEGKTVYRSFFLNKHHSFILTKCSWLAILMAQFLTHCVKYRNLTLISWCGNFVERHLFRRVSGKSTETLRKLRLSTKFPHQEIRWNFGIACIDPLWSVMIHYPSSTTIRYEPLSIRYDPLIRYLYILTR